MNARQRAAWIASDHHLLLSACLLADARAVAAWQSWVARVDLDRLDFSSFRLLPLLYRNLVDLGVAHPELGRLKGVYRRTWWLNQLALNEVAAVMGPLTAAGMQPVLLKGAAFLLGYYPDFGARPMADVDVLVARAALGQAQDVLTQQGWTPARAHIQAGGIFHALPFTRQVASQTLEIDLHWHLLPETGAALTAEVLHPFYEAVTFQGRRYTLLAPTVQLFSALVHGTRASRGSRLHWIADVVQILRRRPDEIDWALVQAWAARWSVQRRLHAALCKVALYTPAPAAVLDALARAPIDWRERLELALVFDRPLTPTTRLVQHYLWFSRRQDLPQTSLGYLRYLQGVWEVPTLRALPAAGLRRLAKRVRVKLGRSARQRG